MKPCAAMIRERLMRRVWVGAFIGGAGKAGTGREHRETPRFLQRPVLESGCGSGGRGAVTGRSRRRGCRGWLGRVPGRELGLVPALGPELGRRQLELVLGEWLGIPGY